MSADELRKRKLEELQLRYNEAAELRRQKQRDEEAQERLMPRTHPSSSKSAERLRTTEFNPLMGQSSGGGGYRPQKRKPPGGGCCGGGGGCG